MRDAALYASIVYGHGQEVLESLPHVCNPIIEKQQNTHNNYCRLMITSRDKAKGHPQGRYTIPILSIEQRKAVLVLHKIRMKTFQFHTSDTLKYVAITVSSSSSSLTTLNLV